MEIEKELAATTSPALRERVGLVIEGSSVGDVLARIREAEDEGLRQIWMTQPPSNADILTLFAAAALQTQHIRLGTAIVPIYPRHPLVMAQQAFAVHELAPERLRLGVGPSHRPIVEYIYGLKLTSPLAYLREYVTILRNVLWEGRVDQQGKFFTVADTLPTPAAIPLLISALGEKAFQLAGEISDGALSWLCPVPYLLKRALPALRAGAEAQQRPAPPLVAHVLVAMNTDQAAVRAAASQRLAVYTALPFYMNMFAEAGTPVSADGTGLDALADALVVAGDETTVKRRITELLASGLDEIMLQPLPIADEPGERKQLFHLLHSL